MKKRETVIRWIIYVAGLLILSLGIILNSKTNLGVSPIVSVSYSISRIFGLNFGNTTFAYYALFVLLEFIIKGREAHLYDLLQIPVGLIFTRFMNVYSFLIPEPASLPGKLIMLVFALLFTGIGVSMSVSMKLIPNPGDGIVAALAWRFRTGMGLMKNIFDLINVMITLVIGLLFGHLFLGIGLGTILTMLGVGRVVAVFNHLFLKKMLEASGLE